MRYYRVLGDCPRAPTKDCTTMYAMCPDPDAACEMAHRHYGFTQVWSVTRISALTWRQEA